MRLKFNLSLESVVKQETNMRVIKLKEFWDSKDSQLVINDRITEVGMAAYWNAMDASVKFNILRREQYVTKQSVSKPAAVPASSVSVPPNSLNPTERRRDPMLDFFDTRCNSIHAVAHRESHEDQFYDSSRSRYERFDRRCFRDDTFHDVNNRYLLPRPRSRR